MRTLGLCALLLSLTAPGLAAAGETPFDPSYAAWDGVLRQHVDSRGRVDYAAVAGDERLAGFLASVAAVAPEELAGWSRSAQVAFYSNAYNALTLKTIVDAMPVASIRDIKPDAWENARWTVAGRKMSLNQIEHKKLRGDLGEYRVHFVLVCAARGCPVLPAYALTPPRIDAQLDEAARAFFTDPARNRIDRASGKVYLSRLLDWYAADFVGVPGLQPPGGGQRSPAETAVLGYLARYARGDDRVFLDGGEFSVVYTEYDWSLNSQ